MEEMEEIQGSNTWKKGNRVKAQRLGEKGRDSRFKDLEERKETQG